MHFSILHKISLFSMSTIRTNHNKRCHINIITWLLLVPAFFTPCMASFPAPPHTISYHNCSVLADASKEHESLIFSHPRATSISTQPPSPLVAVCNPCKRINTVGFILLVAGI
jgi:hypothetical protein